MEPTTALACPYVSFAAFYESLDRLAHAHPPVKITAKLLKLEDDSGIYSHLIGSYKFFELLGEDGLARPELLALAKSSESDRRKSIHDLLFKFYPFLLNAGDSFDLSRAGIDDLRRRINEHDGKSESVTRKSANFFAAAANFAGIDLPRINLKGYKTPGSPDDKRNSSVRENMSSRQSSTGKTVAQILNSEKAATEARRELYKIFFNAKELPESEREDLAQTFIDLGHVLKGE